MYRDVLRQYRQISTHAQQTTLTLHVVLTIPELRSNQVVVLQGAGSSRVRIDPTPQGVLLESWVLSILSPSAPSAASISSTSSSDSQEVSLAAVYKHTISLFRSLYTLTRTLPASKLHKRLRTLSGTSQSLGLEVRISTDLAGVLCFDTPLSPTHATPALTAVHAFPALSTPLGALRASVRYLTSPNLAIVTLESVLSSRFFSQDAKEQREQLVDPTGEEESVAFTPTVLRHRARDSAAGSPSSTGGLRGSSRPQTQVVPPSSSLQRYQQSPAGQGHSRTVSFPTASSAAQPMPLPIRTPNITSSTGSGSDKSTGPGGLALGTSPSNNSPRFAQLRVELPFATSSGRGTPSRVRRDSSNLSGISSERPMSSVSSTSSNLPESGGSAVGVGSTGRPDSRTSITRGPLFKSPTYVPGSLGSPTSGPLLRGSPLLTAGGAGTPSGTLSRPQSIPPVSSTGPSFNTRLASSPTSAGGIQFPTQPPPFAPLSTSAPRSVPLVPPSPTSNVSNKPTPTKRFSSSFGHRYSSSTSSSLGTETSGSGTARIVSAPQPNLTEIPTPRNRSLVRASTSYPLVHMLMSASQNVMLGPTEDEENLSDFINAIDKAGPLPSTVHSRRGSTSGTGSGIREPILPGAGSSSDSSGLSLVNPGGSPGGRPSPPRRRSSGAFERRRSPLMNVVPLPDLGLEEGADGGHGADRNPSSLGGVARVLLNPGPIVATQNDLDERLRSMDATFADSMRGLRERRRAKGISFDGSSATPQAINLGLESSTRSEQEGLNTKLLPRRMLPQSPP